jgi:hypothetical protein
MTTKELREKLYKVGPGTAIDGFELCGACDGLSPGISIDGESIVHCPLCHDGHLVIARDADRWRKEMAERRGR